MRGKKHDPATKAAVLAALLTGQGVNEVSKQYHIPKSVISGWKSEHSSNSVRTKKEDIDEFSELLKNFLRESIKTLTVQVQFFRTEWLKSQGAAELATLFGVTTDKVVRILEAANFSEQREGDSEPDQLEAPARAPDVSIQ